MYACVESSGPITAMPGWGTVETLTRDLSRKDAAYLLSVPIGRTTLLATAVFWNGTAVARRLVQLGVCLHTPTTLLHLGWTPFFMQWQHPGRGQTNLHGSSYLEYYCSNSNSAMRSLLLGAGALSSVHTIPRHLERWRRWHGRRSRRLWLA